MNERAPAAPLRVLVVDDEAPARAKLRRLLSGQPGLQLAGEAASGTQARATVILSRTYREAFLERWQR